jgi:hypothetical protein
MSNFRVVKPYLLLMKPREDLISLVKDIVCFCPGQLRQIGREIVTHTYEAIKIDDVLLLDPEIEGAYAFLCEQHDLPSRRRRADALSRQLRSGAHLQVEVSFARAVELGLRLGTRPQQGQPAKYLLDICTSAWQAVGDGQNIPCDPPMPTWKEECEWQQAYLESCVEARVNQQQRDLLAQSVTSCRLRNSLLSA